MRKLIIIAILAILLLCLLVGCDELRDEASEHVPEPVEVVEEVPNDSIWKFKLEIVAAQSNYVGISGMDIVKFDFSDIIYIRDYRHYGYTPVMKPDGLPMTLQEFEEIMMDKEHQYG